MPTTILIDSHGLFYRTAYAVPETMAYNAEFGFLRSLAGMIRDFPSQTRICCVWDSYCTWRREVFPGYKSKDTIEDVKKAELQRRMDNFRVVMSWILPCYKSAGCEADDTIAALTYLLKDDIVIFSADRDFLQLVSSRTSVYRPRHKNTPELVTEQMVNTEWNIDHPLDLRWLRAFTGCDSDAVPGCGVPQKELSKICRGLFLGGQVDNQHYWLDELEVIMQRAQQLSPGWRKRVLAFKQDAIRNYRVMTLSPPRVDSYLTCDYSPDFGKFFDWVRSAGMSSIQAQLINCFGVPYPPTPLEAAQLSTGWLSYSTICTNEAAEIQKRYNADTGVSNAVPSS